VELLAWLICTVLVFSACFLCIKMWFECCDFGSILFCYLDDSISWVWMNGASLGIVFSSCCYAYFVYWDAFDTARHLAAKLGTSLAVLIRSVFFINIEQLRC
jgi:hypothetical protein